jgi:hypothetical protein
MPNSEDFLGSALRERALSSFIGYEIRFTSDDNLIISDWNNRLNSWQIDGALEHWQVIRTVLAEEVWVNY